MSYTYKYPRPAVTVDGIVISEINSEKYLLLIERKNDPYKHHWALPGGFVDIDEDLPIACKREVQEETSLILSEITQFKTYGTPGRDPRGRTISVVFYSCLNHQPTPRAADDAAKAQWFKLDELPPLAFDHQQIISEFKQNVLNRTSTL